MTNAASITEKLRGEKMDKGMILILVLIGLILGLALVGSDLVNPIQGTAVREEKADQRAMMQPVNEAIARATVQSIDVLRAYEPTRQAIAAKREADLASIAQDDAKARQENQNKMNLIIVVTICGAFLIVMTLGAVILYKMAVNRMEPPQPTNHGGQGWMIPATGRPQRTPAQAEIDPVQALNIRAQNGRCNGHSHGIMGTKEETHTADDDACEPKYPSNNY